MTPLPAKLSALSPRSPSRWKARLVAGWREARTPAAVVSYGRLLMLLGLSGICIVWTIHLIPSVRQVTALYPWDLAVDHQTARGFLAHINPYTEVGAVQLGLRQRFGHSGTGHPPTTSFWALPLAFLSLDDAHGALTWLTVLLLFVELVETSRTLGWSAPVCVGWLMLAYCLSGSFMRYHLGAGQFSGPIGFLYFVAWRAGRRGDDLLCGIALGLACTMKLFPAVMMLFLLFTGRWRALIAGCLAYLAIAVVMTWGYGLASWPFFLHEQPPIADAWMGNIQNQSIHGVMLRLFYPVCVPFGPTKPLSTALSGLVSLALMALGVRWVWRQSTHAERLDLPFALFTVVSVITSQWTWEHYTVIYVLPAAILVNHLGRALLAGDRRWTTFAMLIVALGVIASWQIDMNEKATLQQAVWAGQRQLHLRLHVFDVLNWAPGFVLAALLFAVVRRTREPGPALAQPLSHPI